MGQIFDALKQILGTVLVFFHDVFAPLGLGGAAGMAIICLTILINLIVFPLTLKQTRATRAFQEIQPKVRKLQAEFKDDPQELQRRLMEVQREAGATPGGCLLPLLIQMPIWFALFQLLRTPLAYIDNNSGFAAAMQSETATFLGMHLTQSPSDAWAGGVMVALPYLLIIAFMVATQYVQQWHATYGQVRPDQQGAAAQQAMTKILPLFIGFISWNFPAGLVIYWSTANLFRLGQQALIFKIDGRPSVPKTEEEQEKAPPNKTTGEAKKQQGSADRRRRRRRR
ncbi:MAG TPA: YidC/Oxa1 family membrane protein insertase [Acidimicrobiia bacterium]|jgi:YidC/Oxa1 family membrane protein insertase